MRRERGGFSRAENEASEKLPWQCMTERDTCLSGGEKGRKTSKLFGDILPWKVADFGVCKGYFFVQCLSSSWRNIDKKRPHFGTHKLRHTFIFFKDFSTMRPQASLKIVLSSALIIPINRGTLVGSSNEWWRIQTNKFVKGWSNLIVRLWYHSRT